MIDETHDLTLRSWLASANQPGRDFPIQNLPFGVFRASGSERPRIGVAIGDSLLDLYGCNDDALLDGESRASEACAASTLNALMALPQPEMLALRKRLVALLREGSPERERVARHIVPLSAVEMQLPAAIGDYTDFYASIHHATNVGSMFRPDNPLLPNYKWVPIGYHGRASSIVVSGTAVRRPHGQTRDGEAPPQFGPTKRLDYEMEVGCFVREGNAIGSPIAIADAGRHVFGYCLVNDWSARDV
ncbi:MAG: fumarylacetoacetate hydrolase family protein, partial [Thermoanaerobaculia bacterium]